jgi:hypothetical protein
VAFSILEYITQDDADYAVKKLDGRDLRGVPVRVEPDAVRASHSHVRLHTQSQRERSLITAWRKRNLA